jgi:propanol-preferring alcohol dehydrogenase
MTAHSMLAMTADPVRRCLVPRHVALPVPHAGELLLRVLACGVCRTDLHILDGELAAHRAHVVPGHEVVAEVAALGPGCVRFVMGQRVGVPWLGGSCGHCGFCLARQENLCDTPQFTGYDRDGGFAEYLTASEDYCVALPADADAASQAPLLCAGLIGFRAWRAAGGTAVRHLGLYGFGAAAHIICQLAVAQGQTVQAYTRPGDADGQEFARQLGAAWVGGSDASGPGALDAAIIFASAGELVPIALAATRKGGAVVCAGIHMSPIPAFDYRLLWGERTLRSVANLTREDIRDFFTLLARHPVRTHVQTFPLSGANLAMHALRAGHVRGAAVLLP